MFSWNRIVLQKIAFNSRQNLFISKIIQSDVKCLFNLLNIRNSMKVNTIQQTGKQNERMFIRSTKRKVPKSPIKIRQKIKELEEQCQKQSKKIIFQKQLNRTKDRFSIPIKKQILEKIDRKPLCNIFLQKTLHNYDDGRIKSTGKRYMSSASNKRSYGKVAKKNSCSPDTNQVIVGRPIFLNNKKSSKSFSQNSEQNLNRLKNQNERIKQIYSKSSQKLEQLSKKLSNLKAQNKNQQAIMEDTIEYLKQRIQDKKINIGHLFSYKNEKMTIAYDRIIMQAQNENSSSLIQNFSPLRFKKSSSLSYLSIESK